MKGKLEQIYIKLLGMQGYIKYMRRKGAIIGENCSIYKSVNFGSEPYLITIGNNVRINMGVQLITHDGGVWVLRNDKKYGGCFKNIDVINRIIIGDNVSIGTNAIIMPGVKIGSNCVIGCGSIVTHNIPANTVVAGIPAKVIETLEEYSIKVMNKGIQTKNMTSKEKKIFLLNHIK